MTPPDSPLGDAGEFADDARRYLLESRIATGGMGEVWRARDTTLDRIVAVKVLKREYADDPSFRSRFETEARHAASLHHPGIAAVYDFGEAQSVDGSGVPRPYLVMELVEGQPLSALLRPGSPMDPGAAAALMAQAADAIAAAHAAGIVHRDVKPANLLVTPDRQVKVTDFGIARAADSVSLTQTGQVMGTPQYLSPEQARGSTATEASDVYSLGVVAYECLAGRRPFDAGSPVATALAHLNQEPPALPDSVPAPLAAVVMRALAKDPAERYAGAGALAAALRDPAGSGASGGAAAAAATGAGAAAAADAPTSLVPPVGPPLGATDDPATAVLPGLGAAAAAPVTTPTATTTTTTTGQERRGFPWATLLLVVALVAVVVLVVVLLLTSDDDEEPAPAPTSAPPTSQGQEPTEDTPTPEAPATVEITESDYTGRDYREVQERLSDLGLSPVLNELSNDGNQEPGIVDGVNPTGTLTEGDQITISYWGPRPETPTPTPTPSEATPSPSESSSDAGLLPEASEEAQQ
ncbi:MAG: serine/threonine-protein kinase [Nocardioides sp.]